MTIEKRNSEERKLIYSLTGKLMYKTTDYAVIECGSVGYKCSITFSTSAMLARQGEEQTLYTQMYIKDEEPVLYGFAEMAELDCFKMLITVNGVGPKAALSILSAVTPEKLAMAIAADDIKTITLANGIGKKTAQRIILELKDRVKKLGGVAATATQASSSVTASSSKAEAISALEVLGYDRSSATMAIGSENEELSVEELIKLGLRRLAGQL